MGSYTMSSQRTALTRFVLEGEEMSFTNTIWKINALCFLLLLVMLPARPAKAQADILGEWSPRVYNDGVDVGDYTGIPLNEAGRLRAESWHPDQIDLPENECRPQDRKSTRLNSSHSSISYAV